MIFLLAGLIYRCFQILLFISDWSTNIARFDNIKALINSSAFIYHEITNLEESVFLSAYIAFSNFEYTFAFCS